MAGEQPTEVLHNGPISSAVRAISLVTFANANETLLQTIDTMPAQCLSLRSIIAADVHGDFAPINNVTARTITFRVRLNGTGGTLLTANPAGMVINVKVSTAATGPWYMRLDGEIVTIGTGGTMRFNVSMNIASNVVVAAADQTSISDSGATTVAINTTIQNTLDLTVQDSAGVTVADVVRFKGGYTQRMYTPA